MREKQESLLAKIFDRDELARIQQELPILEKKLADARAAEQKLEERMQDVHYL